MQFDDIIITNQESINPKYQSEHKDYTYYKHEVLGSQSGSKCIVSIYEVPPGKAAYPYHYHYVNEEIFYIIGGKGLLRTPTGEREVSAGDVLAFPASEKGAHKLTNISDTQMLVYLDVDTASSLDVSHMPDSGKDVIWGKGVRKIYKEGKEMRYYDGE